MSKRNQAATLCSSLGVVRLVEMSAKRNCVAVINYHRVGDKKSEVFDELVYSATADELEQQVSYLSKRFCVVTLDEALDLLTRGRPFRGPAVLITFDDGYIDHYRLAFPIMQSLRVQATFFLISSYLHTPVISWWDKIAYLVRNSERTDLRLAYPEPTELSLPQGRRADIIRKVIDLYKSPATTDTQRFMDDLERACEPFPPMPADARLFINVEEAREMVRGGMAIGSHTRTHRILAKLCKEEQLSELAGSQLELFRDLQVPIETIAYPVGSRSAFDDITLSVLQSSAYRAAFSFYGGLNRLNVVATPFDVKRFAVDTGDPFSRFRLRVAGAIATNGYIF